MSNIIWIYHIPVPENIDKEPFTDLFNWLDIEGIEENDDHIKVYVDDSNTFEFEEHLENIALEYHLTYTKAPLEEKNWNEDWEKNFEPVRIDHLVGVRASFHEAFPDVQFDIIINPKMSFGTGHHATTRQVMQMMGRLPLQDTTVLDVGSGTGILAILAAKMGAASVIAVDNDPWCYENHVENNQLNDVSMEVMLGNLSDVLNDEFDLVLANIQRNYLLEHMGALAEKVRKGGWLIMSGILTEDEKDILNKALECHLLAQYLTDADNWACILFQKN
jgi:ribosomal protein L11 methyltransferase